MRSRVGGAKGGAAARSSSRAPPGGAAGGGSGGAGAGRARGRWLSPDGFGSVLQVPGQGWGSRGAPRGEGNQNPAHPHPRGETSPGRDVQSREMFMG